MRLSRLFLSQPISAHSEITADDAVAHYARDVLRLRKGHAVVLFDAAAANTTPPCRKPTATA